MLVFKEFLKENHIADKTAKLMDTLGLNEDLSNPKYLGKGWASPSGKIHTFDSSMHHKNNPHPDFKYDTNLNKSQNFDNAITKGFTRFGSEDHAQHYIHYNHDSEQGKSSALHVLNYLKPNNNAEILLTKTTKGDNPNDEHYTNGPSEAARHILNKSKTYNENYGHPGYSNAAGGLGYTHAGLILPNGKDHELEKRHYVHDDLAREHGFTNAKQAINKGSVRYFHTKTETGIELHKQHSSSLKHAIDKLKMTPDNHNVSVDMHLGGTKGKSIRDFDNPRKAIVHLKRHLVLPDLKEDAPTNNVGSGNIAGAGVGPQGEPGIKKSIQKAIQSRLKKKKRKFLPEQIPYQVMSFIKFCNTNKVI
jgi:hypothetical protein